MGVIAAIVLLVGLGLYEGLRRIPSRPDVPDAERQVTVKGLCPAITMSFEVGIVRGREDEIATGDRAFDGQFLVRGPEDLVRALFDTQTRRALLSLTEGPLPLRDLVLEDGELTAVPPCRLTGREKAALKRGLGKVAKSLRDSSRIARRLTEALRYEGDSGVRRLQLAALVRHHANHPDTLLALHRAGTDADPEVRLIAALALGRVGLPILERLAVDAAVDETLAARAIAALGEHFTAAGATALLASSLAARREEVALACIAALGARGRVAEVPPLLDVAERHGGALRRAARAAVAAIQSRAPGARGDVSLPDVDGGEVSLSTGGGEVSLPPPGDKPKTD